MTTKSPKLSNCCNEPVYIHSMAMKCSKCNNACVIAETKQSVSAEEWLNDHYLINDWNNLEDKLEDSLWTKNVLIYMQYYSNTENATLISKVEQLKIEATVNLKTIEAMESENKELIDGLKLIRNRINLAPKGILPESKFIINQLLQRYKH